jgi:hypothetical protein
MYRSKRYKIGGSQYTLKYISNPANYVSLPGKTKKYLLKNTVNRTKETFTIEDFELDPILFKKITKKDAYFIQPYVYNIKALFEGIYAHNMVKNPMTREPLNLEEISRAYELRYSKKQLKPLPPSRRRLNVASSRLSPPSSSYSRIQTSPLRPLPPSRRRLNVASSRLSPPSSSYSRIQTSPLRPLPPSRRKSTNRDI